MVVLGAIEFVLRLKDEFSKVIKKSTTSAKKASASITKSFKDASLAIKAAFVAIGFAVVKVFNDIIQKTSVSEQALARMVQQFKNVGIASEENILAIRKLANQLQDQTGQSNDAFISSAALAASYNLNAKQIALLLPALADLTAFTTKTTGAASKMEDAVKLMGFVLEGQIGRLKLIGITMTDAQKAMIATGTSAERLTAFLEAVETNAGGVARAMGETFTGQMNVARQSLADLEKEIGNTLLPTMGRFATFVKKRLKEFDIGVSVLSARFAKARLAVSAFLQANQEAFAELPKRFKEIDILLEEDIRLRAGLVDIENELTDATVEGTKQQIVSFSELTETVNRLNDDRRDLLVQIQKEGDETGELAVQLKVLNDAYLTEKTELDAVNEELTVLNESLDSATDKTKNFADTMNEQFGTKGVAAAIGETGFIIEETFRKAQENAGATNEEINEMLRLAEERGKTILRESDRINKAEEKNITNNQTINEQLGEGFKQAVDSSQKSRDKLTNDLKVLKQLVVDIKNEIIILNDTPIEDKSASYTIEIEEIVTRTFV